MTKRYALVRVDNCPSKFEKGFNDYVVCDGRGKDMRLGKDKIVCDNCRYGDTKEQLIRKVAQALEICKNKGYRTITSEEYAKEIVEFLGVEE